MAWTENHIKKLKKEGRIKEYKIITPKANPIQQLLAPDEPRGLTFIKKVLDDNNIPFVTEHYFAEPRKFRFDVALPVLKIAFEYEGLMSKKSRHTTAKGYTKDAEKYNLAQQLEWDVYRYTALNYKNFESDLKKILPIIT